jgi:hypothetical protein
VHRYLERDTSTTLRIKAAKANIAPRAMHASTKVISISFVRRTNRQAIMARGAAASKYARRKNRRNRRYLICKISIFRQELGSIRLIRLKPLRSAALLLLSKLEIIVPDLAWETDRAEDCFEHLRPETHRLAPSAG